MIVNIFLNILNSKKKKKSPTKLFNNGVSHINNKYSDSEFLQWTHRIENLCLSI